MKRKILRGLRVADFIHPDEESAKKKALSNDKVQEFLNTTARTIAMTVDPVTYGTFVKTSEPRIMQIVSDVCEILDVSPVPEVYLCHLMYTNIMPIGSKAPYLVVPDYILRYSDEDMLYYNVGNAVAMIKANHVELATMAAYMPGGGLIELPKLLFTAYLHRADSTSDRGGLLACQSFAAAVKNHFWELGIPPAEIKNFFTTDRQAEIFVEEYLAEQQAVLDEYSGLVTIIARKWQRMSYLEAPTNNMLRELFNWYTDAKGYRAVLARYS